MSEVELAPDATAFDGVPNGKKNGSKGEARSRRKTTLAFDREAELLLVKLAKKKKTSKADLVRRALTLYDWIESERGDSTGAVVFRASEKSAPVKLLLP